MNHHSSGSKNPIQQLEDFLTLYLVKKAPYSIPSSARERIVTIVPWIDLVLLIVFLPLLVALLGLNFALVNFAWASGAYVPGWGLASVIALGTFILEILALPGLFKRKRSAWTLVFYAALLSVVGSLISFSLGGILGGIVGLYILFQVKEYYK
ncbi:MAG: chromate transporter [Patescibacteria group bacterium]